jgi:hypothetical protein
VQTYASSRNVPRAALDRYDANYYDEKLYYDLKKKFGAGGLNTFSTTNPALNTFTNDRKTTEQMRVINNKNTYKRFSYLGTPVIMRQAKTGEWTPLNGKFVKVANPNYTVRLLVGDTDPMPHKDNAYVHNQGTSSPNDNHELVTSFY